MFRLAIILMGTLMIITDQRVYGYTIASRNRDYSNGYSTTGGNTSGFVGLSKESQSDLTDQLSSSSAYIPTSSQRYSTVGANSHSNPTSSYSSSAYTDNTPSNGYGSHSSNTADSLNNIASSYTSDAHTSSDTNPAGYSSSSSNSDGYSSGNGHGSTAYSGYSGSQSANTAGLSGNDHGSSIDYNSVSSSSYPAPSSHLGSYLISGPKSAAYTTGHGHLNSPYSSGHGYISSGHSSYPGSGHAISYPSNHLNSYPGNRHSIATYSPVNSPSSHSSYSDGPRFSASSLSSYLSPHSSSIPSNFMHSSGTSPMRGVPPFMLGASTSINPSYAKSPSFYPGGFSKNGSKYIIIKESPGSHASLMHGGETSFPSRMFTGSSGFKVKSASPFVSGPHPSNSNFASGFHSPLGYSGAGGGHHSGGPLNSYFTYQ